MGLWFLIRSQPYLLISKFTQKISSNLTSTFLLNKIQRIAFSVITCEGMFNLYIIHLLNGQRTFVYFNFWFFFIYHIIKIIGMLYKHAFLLIFHKSFSSVFQEILISHWCITRLNCGISMLDGFIQLKLISLLLSEEIYSCLLFSLCLVSSTQKNYLQILIG